MLKAGFCSSIITPQKQYPMAGYDLRCEESTGVHDDLFVRSVVIGNKKLSCAICTLDLLGVPREMVLNIRRRVSERIAMKAEAIQICATHTHAAPQSIFREFACYDPAYQQWVEDVAVETICCADAKKDDVNAAYAHKEVLGVGCYRDRVREEAEHAMPCDVLWLKAQNSHRRDILLNVYACHPTVLNEGNRLITGDLVFGCAKRLAERFPQADVLFVNGACADVSTRFTRLASDYEEVERLGAIWADAVPDADACTVLPTDRICYKSSTVFIPPARFFDNETKSQVLIHLQNKIDTCPDQQQKREYTACRSVLVRDSYGTETGCYAEASLLQIDRVALCFLPFEYADVDAACLKDELTQKSGLNVVFGCYANGYEGYLPSGRPLDCDSGYEDIASPFRNDAKQILANAFRQLI